MRTSCFFSELYTRIRGYVDTLIGSQPFFFLLYALVNMKIHGYAVKIIVCASYPR